MGHSVTAERPRIQGHSKSGVRAINPEQEWQHPFEDQGGILGLSTAEATDETSALPRIPPIRNHSRRVTPLSSRQKV